MLYFLPSDIEKLIFSFLPPIDVMKTQLVCKDNYTNSIYKETKKKLEEIESKFPDGFCDLLMKHYRHVSELPILSKEHIGIKNY